MKLIHLPREIDWGPWLSSLVSVASCIEGVNGKRLAAAIYHRQVTSIGVNSYKTSPLQVKYAENPHKIYLHAEIEALSKATRRLKGDIEGASAFVIRLSSKGELASARPCNGCMSALLAFGIKEVYFS